MNITIDQVDKNIYSTHLKFVFLAMYKHANDKVFQPIYSQVLINIPMLFLYYIGVEFTTYLIIAQLVLGNSILLISSFFEYRTEVVICDGKIHKRLKGKKKPYFTKSLDEIIFIERESFGYNHYRIHHKGGLSQMNFRLYNTLPLVLEKYIQQKKSEF